MATPPVPSSLKALRVSLRRATDDAMRDRLSHAIEYLERVYGLRRALPQDDGDMRRRKVFCRSPHRLNPRAVRDPSKAAGGC
jgi:hypothetical protein